MKTYKIVRFYAPHLRRQSQTLHTNLTLKEAQKHCNDPKTRKDGEWFDGYTEE